MTLDEIKNDISKIKLEIETERKHRLSMKDAYLDVKVGSLNICLKYVVDELKRQGRLQRLMEDLTDLIDKIEFIFLRKDCFEVCSDHTSCLQLILMLKGRLEHSEKKKVDSECSDDSKLLLLSEDIEIRSYDAFLQWIDLHKLHPEFILVCLDFKLNRYVIEGFIFKALQQYFSLLSDTIVSIVDYAEEVPTDYIYKKEVEYGLRIEKEEECPSGESETL